MLHLNSKGAAVQNNPQTTLVTATAPIKNQTHGGRAKCLQRLVRLDLPVPCTVALSFDAVQKIAKGQMPDVAAVVAAMPAGALMCVRPSSQDPDWGGPGAVLNIGINNTRFEELVESIGEEAAALLYTRFVQSYAVNVARLDPDMFDDVSGDGRSALAQSLHAYEVETEEEFHQDTAVQLTAVLRSMARAAVAAGQRGTCGCGSWAGRATDGLWCGPGAMWLGRVATGR
jgi:pyruvate,orthophosphate dikinase